MRSNYKLLIISIKYNFELLPDNNIIKHEIELQTINNIYLK